MQRRTKIVRVEDAPLFGKGDQNPAKYLPALAGDYPEGRK
jgi:hypothetical protein